ncbi:50S ribosomal protein L4 [Candidatus Curtissbacteria bacterium]|nr:50S ribosomal protein L4 [Candidatus Curtissbacteria bacterium]
MPSKARKLQPKVKAESKKTKSKVQKTLSKPVAKRASSLSAPIFDISGKSQGFMTLPKEVFGQKPNAKLLAQANRIYFANLRPQTASVKTRAEVRGGGKKPWRQKGTGRARAGSTRSPLWAGGGRVFGPKPNDSKFTLPKKMKHKALIYALSKKCQEGKIKVINSFEKITPKTKAAVGLFNKLEVSGKTLLVVMKDNQNIKLATRNLQDVSIEMPGNLNSFKVLSTNNLFLEKAAIEKFI